MDAHLEEQWSWVPSGLHCKYLCQQIFSHAAVTGQSELSPEQDLGVESTTMELICPTPPEKT